MELVLATHNAHKLVEVSRLLRPFELTVVALPRELILPPELGETYAANALVKAQAASGALRRPVIADDSGIEAAALDGRPGVRSARFAGERATDGENLDKLIAEVPAGSGLRYVCALAFAHGVDERVFCGACRGTMAAAPAGQGGFGYDPVFVPEEMPGRTVAELEDGEKDQISHRGHAVRDFARWYLSDRLRSEPVSAQP
jgi:XTP/dITP diphosphohydrolase